MITLNERYTKVIDQIQKAENRRAKLELKAEKYKLKTHLTTAALNKLVLKLERLQKQERKLQVISKPMTM